LLAAPYEWSREAGDPLPEDLGADSLTACESVLYSHTITCTHLTTECDLVAAFTRDDIMYAD